MDKDSAGDPLYPRYPPEVPQHRHHPEPHTHGLRRMDLVFLAWLLVLTVWELFH